MEEPMVSHSSTSQLTSLDAGMNGEKGVLESWPKGLQF